VGVVPFGGRDFFAGEFFEGGVEEEAEAGFSLSGIERVSGFFLLNE